MSFTMERGTRYFSAFQSLHGGARRSIPPFLVFTKGPAARDVFFRGLAVPGSPHNAQDDLVAVWRTRQGQRFQNYRAVFTVLAAPVIRRTWITDLRSGDPHTANAPPAWERWVQSGSYSPLAAPITVRHRTRAEQTPSDSNGRMIVATIIRYFKEHPMREYAFEACAAQIAMLMDPHITECDLTRPWRDGGRDALGLYRIGSPDSHLNVEFAIEAKCKEMEAGAGVHDTSRLIARLRHRQFGVFVTTSYLAEQAYKEIVDDGHPVVIVAAKDIARILADVGYSSVDAVSAWLTQRFPYTIHNRSS